ncbi:nucleotidyltransferase family protein [Aquirufa antheringensis]|uniref:nucleotidyltransferase family protein n=1 Tax=Aquirufa antheringensis TaxID=2516559 RepID=UPI001F9F7E69|nr:NTP transferase domain-containing protein [Pseudarcicella sp. GAP-15]
MTGLILAAGASSRLGEAKQLLVYQGQSLLERSIRLAFSVCQDVQVCLGAEVDQSIAIIEQMQIEFPALTFVQVEHWDKGMGESLAVGLRTIDISKDVLVLLCDLPFLTSTHLKNLTSLANTERAIVASFQGVNSPPVLIPSALRPLFNRWSGDQGLGKFWRQNPMLCEIIHFSDKFRDVDVPEDREYWGI